MTKKIKKEINIILKQNITNLGNTGNLVTAKAGYARNFLIPNNLAELATPVAINKYELKRQELVEKEKSDKIKFNALKEKLENNDPLVIKKRVGEENKIFGKLTKKQIIETILAIEPDLNINPSNVEIPDIEKLGEYRIIIELFSDIKATIKIAILPQ